MDFHFLLFLWYQVFIRALKVPSRRQEEEANEDASVFLSFSDIFWQLGAQLLLATTQLSHKAMADCRENEDMQPSFWVIQIKITGSIGMGKRKINICRCYISSSLGSRIWDRGYFQGSLLESVLGINSWWKVGEQNACGRCWTAPQSQQRSKPIPFRVVHCWKWAGQSVFIFQLWSLTAGCRLLLKDMLGKTILFSWENFQREVTIEGSLPALGEKNLHSCKGTL